MRRRLLLAGLLAALALGLPAAPAPAQSLSLRSQTIPFSDEAARPENRIAAKLLEKELQEATRIAPNTTLRAGLGNVGTPEKPLRIIGAEIAGSYSCGSAGCDLFVFVEAGKGWVQAINTLGSTLSVAATADGGPKDIVIDGNRVWRWRDGRYQKAK